MALSVHIGGQRFFYEFGCNAALPNYLQGAKLSTSLFVIDKNNLGF
jgi:hypothetical protein